MDNAIYTAKSLESANIRNPKMKMVFEILVA